MPAKPLEKRGLMVQRMDTVEETDGADDTVNSTSYPLARSVQHQQHTQHSRQVVTESGPAVRLPIEYGSINMALEFSRESAQLGRSRAVSDTSCRAGSTTEAELARTSAAISRYKYYSRIAPGASSRFIMPAHVVPPRFLMILPFKSVGQNQSSIITIFSIWNTMMGTSLLSMPWAVKESGFAMSLVALVVMTGLTCYTAYRVLDSYNRLLRRGIRVSEFSDVCRHYMGRGGEVAAVFFSGLALIGAVVVYWVLLSNFMYQTGQFIYNYASGQHGPDDSGPTQYVLGNRTYNVLCPLIDLDESDRNRTLSEDFDRLQMSPAESVWAMNGTDADEPLFNRVWSKTGTVPFFLLLVAWPLISIKSPSFFSKFNALGTVAAGYLLLFVLAKAIGWGFNMNFTSQDSLMRIQQFSPKFFSYTGILSVALFCHCFLILLVKPAKNPKNNTRDLIIAYVCVSITYLFVGGIFYAAYPLSKFCIEQNLLDNIPSSDILAFTARIFLLIQMLTVFPLLMYILRAQMMYYFYKAVYPSWLHVLLFHIAVVGVAILVAMFYPNIGNILRFSGAICGLAHIFTLPTVVYLISERQAARLTPLKCIVHLALIAIGLANFVAQFFMF
ncbi:hypothetical protein BOX15_Mlig002873g1 [Macrostomum lignano]|uniref:Uncharacterized protein n=2 Tax=Macrostomum lignano TaxID=282301 RepID=A0A267EL25_9PLAT|nr:hypothetical protein BOX15_Mlig002873g1 [Macrostomum lignano]